MRTPDSVLKFHVGEMARRADCKVTAFPVFGGIGQGLLIENVGKRLVQVTETTDRNHYLEPGEKTEIVLAPEIEIVALNNGL